MSVDERKNHDDAGPVHTSTGFIKNNEPKMCIQVLVQSRLQGVISRGASIFKGGALYFSNTPTYSIVAAQTTTELKCFEGFK